MQVTTGNAAAAIAFRNAVLKVVPKAVTAKVINEIKDVAMGKSIDLETKRQNMLAYFAKLGVSQEEILDYCGCEAVDRIDAAMIFELSGVKNAIKEGTTTVQEVFRQQQPQQQAAAATQEQKRRGKAADAVSRAMEESARLFDNGAAK